MQLSASISPEDKLTTILQVQGLTFLKEHPKTTVGELAAELTMSSPAIAKFTDKLVDCGWVERIDDPDDRRIVRLLITIQGEKEFERIKCKHFEKMSEIFSLMPEEDIKEMIRIMEDLTRRWEEKNK